MKKSINKIRKHLDMAETLSCRAQSEATSMMRDFIPYIKDYDEVTYGNWSVVQTPEGLCFSDGELLTAPLDLVLDYISEHGGVTMFDIRCCGV